MTTSNSNAPSNRQDACTLKADSSCCTARARDLADSFAHADLAVGLSWVRPKPSPEDSAALPVLVTNTHKEGCQLQEPQQQQQHRGRHGTARVEHLRTAAARQTRNRLQSYSIKLDTELQSGEMHGCVLAQLPQALDLPNSQAQGRKQLNTQRGAGCTYRPDVTRHPHSNDKRAGHSAIIRMEQSKETSST